MPHRSHKSTHTHRQIHEMFSEALAPFGHVPNQDYYERVMRIPVGGVAFGDRFASLQAAHSNVYEKEEHDTLAVLRLLVQLDLDGNVIDVIERDKPDRAVHFTDGEKLFVEVSRVESGQLKFTRYLEDANHRIEMLRQTDSALRDVLNRYNVVIRVQPNIVAQSIAAVVAETIAYLKSATPLVGAPVHAPVLSGLLNDARAEIFWRVKGHETRSILHSGAEWVNHKYLAGALLHALDEKRIKSIDYEAACLPIWLLLCVADERLLPEMVAGGARRALTNADIAPFEKVIVTYPGMKAVTATQAGIEVDPAEEATS